MSGTESPPVCGFCRFRRDVRTKHGAVERSLCRRFPPQIVASSPLSNSAVFPAVRWEWSCGEFQPRLEPYRERAGLDSDRELYCGCVGVCTCGAESAE